MVTDTYKLSAIELPRRPIPLFEEPFDKFLHFARPSIQPRKRTKCKNLSNGSLKWETDTDRQATAEHFFVFYVFLVTVQGHIQSTRDN